MDWYHCICDNNVLFSACIQLDPYMARWSVNTRKSQNWQLETDRSHRDVNPSAPSPEYPGHLRQSVFFLITFSRWWYQTYGVDSFFPWTSYVYNKNFFCSFEAWNLILLGIPILLGISGIPLKRFKSIGCFNWSRPMLRFQWQKERLFRQMRAWPVSAVLSPQTAAAPQL